jgi:tetrahydromethanopterin S-methyltransferase subunit B
MKNTQEIIISYKNGRQILEHPTGVITEYTKDYLIEQKNNLLIEVEKIQDQITELDIAINNCAENI